MNTARQSRNIPFSAEISGKAFASSVVMRSFAALCKLSGMNQPSSVDVILQPVRTFTEWWRGRAWDHALGLHCQRGIGKNPPRNLKPTSSEKARAIAEADTVK